MTSCHAEFEASTYSDVGVIAGTKNLAIEKSKNYGKNKKVGFKHFELQK